MSNARTKFGLSGDASADEVKARWRELAGEHHPDRGGDGAEFSRWRKLYRAALDEAEEPLPCSACHGSGRTTVTRGFVSVKMPCEACGGEGVKS